MLELLDRAPRTTAVVAYNDLMAIGAMRAVRRRGRRVPRDVSVVGFDDVALAAYVDPPLTTIAQSTAEMGRWAVEQLIGAACAIADRAERRPASCACRSGCRRAARAARLRGLTGASVVARATDAQRRDGASSAELDRIRGPDLGRLAGQDRPSDRARGRAAA